MAKIIPTSQNAIVKESLNQWVDYLEKGESLVDFFKDKDGKIAAGFDVSFFDYLSLVNSVGTQVFKVRFGLVANEDRDLKFALFLWGEDKTGNQTSPFLQLDYQDWIVPVAHQHIVYNEAAEGQANTVIPGLLAYNRLRAWNALGEEPSFPFNDLFQMEQYKTGLQGYTYQWVDFVSVLSGFNNSLTNRAAFESVENTAKIRFSFNCLGYDFDGEKPRKGYFDILISVVIILTDTGKENDETTEEIRGLFSDTGIPCPPLCGGN